MEKRPTNSFEHTENQDIMKHGATDPDPEKEKFAKDVFQLFKVGLDSKDIYAFHGTTIEAIQYLSKHGTMPHSQFYGKEFYYAQLNPKSRKDVDFNYESQLEHAEFYAEWNVWKYYVLERLGFVPSDMSGFMYMDIDGQGDRLYKEFLEEAEEHGVNDEAVRSLIKEAENNRKGVVVTLSKGVKKDFKEAEVDEDQRSISTPSGLPIKYITGIKPLGEYEKELLEQMGK